MITFNYILNQIINFLFPIECFWCQKTWTYLCLQCLWNCVAHPELCPLCHCHSPNYRVCFKCRSEKRSFAWIIVWFYFEWIIKEAILWLKYYHHYDITDILSEKLKLLFLSHPALSHQYYKNKESLAISFLPSHRTRKVLQKWYNQSELLAQSLAKSLGINFLNKVEKSRRTRRQTGLSRKTRVGNLRGAFQLAGKLPEKIRTIIIVDDVVSTGSSIHEVGKCYKENNSNISIWWLCIARK